MSLFVIADLHLSTNESTNKSMEVFGRRWQGYTEKLAKNWKAVVTESDTVVIPGDISWAMNIEEAVYDFKFIDSLPGKKIITKGNHDFWWSTATKIKGFFKENNITSIELLHNNAFEDENFIICGSRGWFNDESFQNTVGGTAVNYEKIVSREVIRLSMSLEEGLKLKQLSPDKELLVFLHFPPVYNDFICREIINVLHKYNIEYCFYGHIHGNYYIQRHIDFEGIRFVIAASDYLNFTPMPVFPLK